MDRVTFVGAGRLGLALGDALSQAGLDLPIEYWGRTPEPPHHRLFSSGLASYHQGVGKPRDPGTAVLLTVRDGALEEVASSLSGRGRPPEGCVALHCSGALGLDFLSPLRDEGYSIGSLHPLDSIASPVAESGRFQDVFFAVSGEPEALAVARRIVSALDARPIPVPTGRRPLYHAAAVVASNYLVTLLDVGIRLFQRAGATAEEAEAAITRLAGGTVENVRNLGAVDALTGPVARGDVETVELPLRALEPEEATLYATLGTATLGLVEGRLDPEIIRRFEILFEGYL